MASPRLYAEIWKRPGHATFGKVIADVPVISASGTSPVNGVGQGTIVIPKSYDRLDEILKPDPTTPGNAVSSLVRVFSESSSTPIYEFIPAVFTGEQDKADPDIEITGPAIDVIWGYARLEPWDWTGIDEEASKWPDWIWGGRNVLGALESAYKPAITRMYRDVAVTGGTFTIGISFNGGAISNTNNIAWNATGAALDTELTAELVSMGFPTASLTVTGSGSIADPWVIQTVLPEGEYVFSVNSGGLTPSGLVFQDRETIGAVIPAGWTTSFNPVNNISHGPVSVFRASTYVSPDPAAPPCDTTGVAIAFDGDTGSFPGIQKIVAVKPGGRYYASATAYAQGGSGTYRFVIRDLYENPIAAEPDFNSGTTLTANTWTTFDNMTAVVIPDDVDRVIVRFASVDGGNPPLTFVTCLELREGMPPTTWGSILTQLWLDASTDHAGRRVWQIGAGATDFLTLGFDAVNDSAGAPWADPEVSITLKRGQSYLRVLGECYKAGYEGRVDIVSVGSGTWELNVYNTGTMGVRQDLISNGPSIQGGRDVTKRDLRRFLPPATDVAVEAAGQAIARARSTTAITALGRIEQYIPNQDLGSMVEAALNAAQARDVNLQRSQSLSYTLTPTTLDPEPFIAYRGADTVYVLDPPDIPTRTARRIKSLGFAWTPTTVEYPVQLESDSYVGLGGIAQSVDFLLKEFKAIRERPDETTDALNYFPAGGTGTPTVVLAAYNATETSKDKADFVCTGINDEGVFALAFDIITSHLNDGARPIAGRIVLTEGDFYLGATIDLHYSVWIEGMGSGITRLHSLAYETSSTATNVNMFHVDHNAITGSIDPITISGLEMHGHKTIQTSGSPAGIYVDPNGNAILRFMDIDVHDFRGWGAFFDRCADWVYMDRCRFRSNTLSGIGINREGHFYVTNSFFGQNTEHGIIAPGAYITLLGCDIRQNTLDGFNSIGILQQPGQVLIGNHFYSNRIAISLTGEESIIANNFVYNNTDGIFLEGNSAMTVTGNMVWANYGYGMTLTGVMGGVASGNTIINNLTNGIVVAGTYWNVVGNRIENVGNLTTNTYDGIQVTGSNNDIKDNYIHEHGGGGAVMRYGVNIVAGATCNVMVGNSARGSFGSAPFADAGTDTQKLFPADSTYGDNFTDCGEGTPPEEPEGGADDVTAPAVPVGLTAAAGDTFIYLNWTSNTELDMASYKVYKATSSGGTYTLLATVEESEHTDTGLVNGTPLWFKITAVDSSGNESSMTASVTATPAVPAAGVAPAVPTGLTAVAGDKLVQLDWTDNTETDLASYNIYRATASGGPYTNVGSSVVSDFTATGLTNGTQYWFKVSAVDTGTNESAQSSSANATPAAGTTTSGRPTPTVVFDNTNLYSAAKVTAEAAGTVFGFTVTGGNGSGPSYNAATVPVKDNNEYVFDLGAVLDGQGTTALAFATDAAVTGVKIWDCEWTDYTGQNSSGTNNTKGGGAIRMRDGWEIYGGIGHHNKYSAARYDGDNIIVEDGEYSYNGQYAFAGSGTDNFMQGSVADGLKIHHNGGISSLDIGGDTGGCKIVQSIRFTFLNIESYSNLATGTQGGNGLWTDIDNIDTLYDSCNVHDNQGAGIFHEVSLGAEIKNCTLTNNGQDNSGGGIHPVKANIQLSNSGGDLLWVHDNTITVTTGSLGYYGISMFNSNHFQWTASPTNVNEGCLGARNMLIEDNVISMSGSQWKAAIAITGNLPTSRNAAHQCGQSEITATASNNRIRNNTETLSGGAHTSTPYIRAGVRVSAAAWSGFGYT